MNRDQQVLVNMYNKTNWKKTRTKEYEVYICRPSLNTKVIDKLTGYKDETTKDKQFIVYGILGSKSVIGITSLILKYKNLDGTAITTQQLSKRMNSRGQIEWFKVKTISQDCNYYAFNIPRDVKNIPIRGQKGVYIANKTGIEHGCGDFLVASMINKNIDFDNVTVINGNVFSQTFDMRSFPGCIEQCISRDNNNIVRPKSIIEDTKTNDRALKANKNNLEIVGKIEKGKQVIGYMIKNTENNKVMQVNKEVAIYLVGGGRIRNCKYQFYKGKVLFRGIGVDLNKLPIKRV